MPVQAYRAFRTRRSHADESQQRKNPRPKTGALALASLADLFLSEVLSKTDLVDLIHVNSNNSVAPRTPDELRVLAAISHELQTVSKPVAFKIGQRLGQERHDEIVRRYRAGETAQALADEFGVAKSALLNLLRANRVTVRRASLTNDQIKALAHAYKAGKTIAVLEVETGIPHGTIQRALKNAGANMRPRGFSSDQSLVR